MSHMIGMRSFRKLVLLFSILSFVLGGATFSHAVELHGHGHGGIDQVTGSGGHHGHGLHHHTDEDHDDDGTAGATVHCGASILGLESADYGFSIEPRAAHDVPPMRKSGGRPFTLDPPPPRLLHS